MSKIKQIWSRQILDSRANPTVEVACILDSGSYVVASVPSGASTGTHEALELRDRDPNYYMGKGVLKAVENINTTLNTAVSGMDPSKQFEIDQKIIALDGTPNKTKLGANAILGVSLVVAKAAAVDQHMQPFRWIENLAKSLTIPTSVHLPTPIFNMINGGLHGAGNLDFQEFHVIPATSRPFSEALRSGVEIYHGLGETLVKKGAIHSVGDEGGYAPNLFTNADALEILIEAITFSKYSLGREVFLGLDVAASTFFDGGVYTIRDKSTPLDENALIEYYKSLNDQYHLAILEDPLEQDQWAGWAKLTEILGKSVTVVGDDLLVTNITRVQKAVKEKACNAILVKPNQIGTLSETLNVIKVSKDAGLKIIVSHRSGETNDWFIADFAVGVGADYVKFGAPDRGERVAKYNRLSAIDLELTAR